MTPSRTQTVHLPLYLDSAIPDGFAVDPEQAHNFTEWSRPHEESGLSWIPFHYAHKARETAERIIEESEGRYTTERWFQRAMDDIAWVNDVWFKEHPFGVAFSISDRVIIRSRMSLTLQKDLELVRHSDWYYSEVIGGWVLLGMDTTDEVFTDLLAEHEIVRSPGLENQIVGAGRWEEELERHHKHAAEMGYEVPRIFPTDRTYKDHQKKSVVAMAGMGRVLLADQVGLGKGGSFSGAWLSRLQAAKEGTADSLADRGPCVVITTKSMRPEIAEEITKWNQDARIEVLSGRSPAPIDDDVDFIVLNIDLLSARLDDILDTGSMNEAKTKRMGPYGMIIDEAHMVKNTTALRTKAAQNLANHIVANYEGHQEEPFIILASGTPFLNRPAELWSLLRIAHIDEVFTDFIKHKVKGIGKRKIRIYVRGGGKRDVPIDDEKIFQIRWCDGKFNQKFKQWEADGVSNPAELNRLLLSEFMVRRKKSDIMHPLPPLNENVFQIEPDSTDPLFQEYLEMEETFRDWALEEAADTARAEREAGNDISVQAAVKIMARKLDNAEGGMRYSALRQAIARYKISHVRDWIRRFMEGDPEITGGDPNRKKLIVFAHHREIQQELLDDPELDNYGKVWIVAGQSSEEIQEFKRRFQKDENTRLMICYMGAREGHTLTAAYDILLAELPYVPSWIVQMAGRCWARISEDFEPHEANIHYSIVRGTLDTILFQKNRIKKSMFNSIIDGEDLEDTTKDGENVQSQGEVFLEMVSQGKRKISIAA